MEEADVQQSSGCGSEGDAVEDDGSNGAIGEKLESMHISERYRFLSQKISGLLSDRVLGLVDLTNNGLDRVILVLGFVAIATGVATYYGLFVSHGRRSNQAFAYSRSTARDFDFQRPRTLCQGWYIFLVWATDFRSLDGLFCRVRLGLEYKTPAQRGRVEKGVRALRRVRRVLRHLSLRLDQCLPRASCRLGSSMVCPGSGARVHLGHVFCWRLGTFGLDWRTSPRLTQHSLAC